MTAKKNKVELRIAGKDYKVVGSESVEYIHRVGLYVDRKMTDILKMNNKLSTSLAAVHGNMWLMIVQEPGTDMS